MLKVLLPETEFYDSGTGEFIKINRHELLLEHSLIALKKWEQKWHVRFLDDDKHLTQDQTLDYIRCMTINADLPLYAYKALPSTELERINKYIKDPMSATTFFDIESEYGDQDENKREKLSAEVIYYMMFQRGIPIECEKWHLNSLFALIKVYNYYSEKSRFESEKNRKGKNGRRPTASEMELRNRLHEERKRARLKQ